MSGKYVNNQVSNVNIKIEDDNLFNTFIQNQDDSDTNHLNIEYNSNKRKVLITGTKVNNDLQNNIIQLDGNNSYISNSDSDISSENNESILNGTTYETDEEVNSSIAPVNLIQSNNTVPLPGVPIKLNVNINNYQQSSLLPFCICLNARSVNNKCDNFKKLYQLGPDCILVSETWETPKNQLINTVSTNSYHIISQHRGNKKRGGGCAIVYNQNRFIVERIEIEIPSVVEGVWALFTPKVNTTMSKVKRIAVASFYVSPNSPYKLDAIDHIVESIHLIRTKYDNEVNFLLGGDFNRLNINSILD